MANLKKPTREQKELMKKYRLKWENWLIPRGGEDNISLTVVNKASGKRRVLLK